MQHLSDIIRLSAGFKTAVNLEDDLDNLDKAAGFIPTRTAADILVDMGTNLHPTARQRSRLITGTYGTGKSHLALVLANLYRSETDALEPVLEKMRSKWEGEEDRLRRQLRDVEKPFLIVLLEGHEGHFDDALLRALRKALAADGKADDVMPQTSFTAALQRIDEMETDFPESYERLEAEVEDSELVSIEALRSRIEQYDREAYDRFCELHRLACGGAAFSPDSVMSPKEVYPAVAQELRRSGHYGGIAVLWDEFGHYMEGMVRNPRGAEAEEIQRFAEVCNGSGQSQLHLYLICHRSLQEYVEVMRIQGGAASSETLSGDLRKVSGRFTSFRMETTDEETFELIDNVVIQDNEDGRWDEYVGRFRDQFDSLTDRAVSMGLFPTFSRAELDATVTRGAHPLHPMTAYCLPLLSERVAQNERTLFKYLADNEPAALGEFVGNTEVGDDDEWPPVVPLDALWDYFEEAIRQEPRTKALYQEFRQANSNVSPEDALGKRVLNATGVITAVQSDRLPGATEDVLAYALGLHGNEREELTDCLKSLSSSDTQVLVKRQSDGAYRFYRGGAVVMEERVQETVDERADQVNWIDHLNEHLWEDLNLETYIPATSYADERFMSRALQIEAVSVEAAANPRPWVRELEKDEELDGFALVLLPQTADELDRAVETAEDFARGDDYDGFRERFLVAIPDGPVQLERWVREHDALRQLRISQPAIYGEGGEQVDEWEAWMQDRTDAIRDELARLLNADEQRLSWYWRGEEQTSVRTRGALCRLATEVMNEVFPLTPTIPHDKLTDRSGNDTYGRYRQPIIDTLFKPDAPMFLRNETDQAQKHIIRAVYERSGILREEMGQWVIGRPDDDQSPEVAAIWDVIEEFVEEVQQAGTPQPVKPLIDELIRPPYGVSRRALSLFIAPVIAEHVRRGNLMLDHHRTKTKTDRIRQPSGEDIDNLVASPADYEMLYVDLTDRAKAILVGVARAFDVELSGDEDVSELISTVSDGLRTWWFAQPEHTKITENVSDASDQLRGQVLQPLAMPAPDAEDILLRQLQDLIEHEDVPLEQLTDRVASAVAKLRQELEDTVVQLNHAIDQTICEVFVSDGEDEVSAEDALIRWFQQLPSEQQEHCFSGDAGEVMAFIRDPENSDLSQLCERLVGSPPEDWGDQVLERLHGHLTSAKRTVEAYVSGDDDPPGPKPPPPPRAGIIRVTVTEGDDEFRRSFAMVEELSENGKSMMNIVRSTIEGIGRTLPDGECPTVLVRILKEVLNGP